MTIQPREIRTGPRSNYHLSKKKLPINKTLMRISYSKESGLRRK